MTAKEFRKLKGWMLTAFGIFTTGDGENRSVSCDKFAEAYAKYKNELLRERNDSLLIEKVNFRKENEELRELARKQRHYLIDALQGDIDGLKEYLASTATILELNTKQALK